MGCLEEVDEIFVGTVPGGYTFVVPHVVTCILKWRVKTRIDPQGVTAQGFYVVQFFYDAGDIANAVTIGVVKALGINFIKYSVVQPGSGHVPFRPFHSLCSACCQFHYSTGRDICLSFLKRPGPFCKGPYRKASLQQVRKSQSPAAPGDCQGKCRGVRVTLPGVWHISCRSFGLCVSLHSFRTILIKNTGWKVLAF